jgi:hypothetical protein
MKALHLVVLCAALALPAAAQEIAFGKSVYVGGKVDITDPVQGTVRAAGGEITLSAPVSGDAHLAGGSITVKGAVSGDLRAAGGSVVIDSPIGGDATVGSGSLELGPNARIAGKLVFRGGELKQDPAAQVIGGIEQHSGRMRHAHDFDPFGRFARGWLWTVGLMVMAAIIAAALPGPTRRMATELREHPWTAPLIGFIALTCIPIAAVLIMITIVGIPIGILAILGYAALLLVGYVWLSVVVGGMLLDRFRADIASQIAWRVGAAVIAMLVLALLARVPFVGGWVAFAALIVGVGMVVSGIFRKEAPPNSASENGQTPHAA